MAEKALSGVKVLEYAQFVAGPYCAKLLADLGAEVIKIEEPQTGDEARGRGPFSNDIPHSECSGLFLYANTNKLGITLNPGASDGKRLFLELVKGADILIEDRPPGEMKRLGLDYETLKATNPRLIVTSIAPFGQTGPYADYKTYHLNSYLGSMLGSLLALDGREPVKAGGVAGEYVCGVSSAAATLAALYAQGLSGRGQHLDLSKQEMLISVGRVVAVLSAFDHQQQNPGQSSVRQCQDGWSIVMVGVEERQWLGLVELMGNPEWARDERLRDMNYLAEHRDEIERRVSEWSPEHTRDEIYHRGQALGSPTAPVLTPEEVVNSEQLAARGFFADIEHPRAGRIKYPTAPYRFSRTPWAAERPAPLLGQHNEEIYCGRLGYTKEELVRLKETGAI